MAFSRKDEKWDQLLRLEEDPTPPKTSRFMSLSIAMHSILAISAAMMATPILEIPEVTTVEFEISDSVVPLGELSELVPETRGSSAAPIAPQVKQVPIVETKAPKAQKIATPKAVTAAPKVSAVASEPIAESDLLAPSFDDLASTVSMQSSESSELSDTDLDSALQSVSINQQSFDSLPEELSAEAETFAGESDLALADAEARAQSQLKSLASSRSEKRAQEMAAINAAKQLEQEQSRAAQAAAAAAGLAAQQEADRIAQAKAAEQALARGNGGGTETGAAEARGAGVGNEGLNKASNGSTGSPQGTIRKLEQLRQMPGNKKPTYSVDERRKRQSGVVTFQAYVTPQGRLKNFRQVRTTGYANLDEKAFKALKDWKFYPGQEGWVELPFVWSLVGAEKALGGALRTR